MYYVHADHLGSPRAITRPANDAIVWKWDNTEPFGANAANENPSGLGAFRYDLRFPGQQYDAETGTSYNYFRDYDPAVGRYLQSDPIGLRGAINTFLYVSGAPLRWIDPRGLRVFACTRSAFGPPERAIGNHTYLFDDTSGRFCGMQQSSGLGGDPRHGERGPGGGDSCVEIPNAESVASDIMNCCEASNRGPWIPFANDCFTVANSCVDSYLPGPNPRAPGERFRTDCNSCWKPQPQPAFPH